MKQNKLISSRMQVKGRTCYWLHFITSLTHVSNKTRTNCKSTSFHINPKRRTQQKSQILTYLLSFFSGGDFLSQPWKRISPPLMFVALSAVCCALTARPSQEHDGSWRLVCSKSCQRSARTAAVCCLHWIKTKVVQSADVAGHSCYFGAQWSSQKCPTGKKRKNTKRDPRVVCTLREGAIAEKLSWCGARKYRRVSAVCFPTHTTPTEQREGWAAVGWTGWENRLHCSKVLKRAGFWANLKQIFYLLYVR